MFPKVNLSPVACVDAVRHQTVSRSCFQPIKCITISPNTLRSA
uniref:Uncharacterized protein n=1 Tax=Anguilla anguilla TaxID=7936 RepID=A0A0E9UJ16_ANGAN